jgi:hypothetical protein
MLSMDSPDSRRSDRGPPRADKDRNSIRLRNSQTSQGHHVLGITFFRLGQGPAKVVSMNENLASRFG